MDQQNQTIIFALLVFIFSAFILNAGSHYTSDAYAYRDLTLKFAGEEVGEIHPAYTRNMLYPLVSSIFYRLTSNIELSLLFTSFLFFMILVYFSFKIGRDLNLDLLVFTAFIVCNPILLIYSSLYLSDVPALAMAAATIFLFLNESYPLGTVTFILATLARFPYIILFLPLLYLLYHKKNKIYIIFLILALIPALIWPTISGGRNPIEEYAISTTMCMQTGNPIHCAKDASLLFWLVFSMFNLHLLTAAYGFTNDKLLVIRKFFIILVLLTFIYQFIWTTYVRRYFLPALIPIMAWSLLGVKEISRLVESKFKIDKKHSFYVLSIGIILLNVIATYLYYHGPT